MACLAGAPAPATGDAGSTGAGRGPATGPTGAVPAAPAAPPAEAAPVTAARLRAEDLLTRFAVQAEQLAATLKEATAAFATMGDPA
ncbi:hypothetical protein AC529_10215, partial [Thermobifida cellulosilytica TB100]